MHIYAALCFFFLLQANFLCSGVKIREIAEVVTEKTEQDAFNKLLKLENKAKNLIESVIKRALPIALRNGQDADLSEECMGSFLKMIIGIKDMKLWAIKMIDATGKPGSGVLSGNLMAHGDYHQCLGTVIPVDSYSAKDQVAKTAKYCRVGVRTPLPPKSGIPETFQSVFKNINVTFKTEVMAELSKYFFTSYLTTPKIGVCVPSSCTDNDMRQILSVASKVLELYFELEWCEVKTKNSLSSTQITTCILLLIFPFMCLIATIYVEFVKYRLGEEYAKKNVSYVFRILLCFSLIDNLQRLMITRPSEKRSLDCIHGIRYITSTWVMLGHTYGLLNLFMLGNFFNVENILDDIFVSAITNGFLSVSSFFFITATLISFGVVKQFDKTKNFNFLIFLLRRIWRLLPDILVLIGIFSILPNISSGPDYKETIDDFVLNCKEYWWTNVFFFSNFIDNNHQEKSDLVPLNRWFKKFFLHLPNVSTKLLGEYL